MCGSSEGNAIKIVIAVDLYGISLVNLQEYTHSSDRNNIINLYHQYHFLISNAVTS